MTERERMIVFDVETTGLDPKQDRIIQLALVVVEDGKVVRRACHYFNPGFPISTEITKLTGITNEMLASAPREAEMVAELAHLFGHAQIVVAHNLPFDLRFLNEMLERYNYLDYRGDFIDTLTLARLLFPGKPNRLGNLAERLGVKLEQAHNAVDDAYACYEVLGPLVKLAEQQGIPVRNVLAQLEEYPLEWVPAQTTQVFTLPTLPWSLPEGMFVSDPPKPFSYNPNGDAYYLNMESGWMTVGPEFFRWPFEKRKAVVLNTNAQRLLDRMNADGSLRALALSGWMGPITAAGRLKQGFEGARTPEEFVRKAYWALFTDPDKLRQHFPEAYTYLAVRVLHEKVYHLKRLWREFHDKPLPSIPVPSAVTLVPAVSSPSAPKIGNGRIVCLDFDGVLTDYRGWRGEWEMDPPVKGAREFVEQVIAMGFKPVIHCSRHPDAVRSWLRQYGFPDIEVVPHKPVAFLYIDYRGFRFDGKNWDLAKDAITKPGWAWQQPAEDIRRQQQEKERALKQKAKEQNVLYSKGVVSLSFDGVLSESDPSGPPGPPIPGAREFVAELHKAEYEPVVFTHRDQETVETWLQQHGFLPMRVLNAKRRRGEELAVPVVRNHKVKVYIERNGFRFTGDNWEEALDILKEGDVRPICVTEGGYTRPQRLLFLDTETTGLSRIRNRIVQIAAILVENGEIKERYSVYVHPEGGEVSAGAIETTGIYTDGQRVLGVKDKVTGNTLPVEAVSQAEALGHIRELLTPGTVLVCHNTPFDLGFLVASFKRLGLPEWRGVMMCTLSMWRYLEKRRFDTEYEAARAAYQAGDLNAFLHVRPMESGRLSHICQLMGIPFSEEEEAHDALNDIEATIKVFNKLLPQLEAIGFDPRNTFVQLSNVKADWLPSGIRLITISAALPEEVRRARSRQRKGSEKGTEEALPREPVSPKATRPPSADNLPKPVPLLNQLLSAVKETVAESIKQLRPVQEPPFASLLVTDLSPEQIDRRLKRWPFIRVQQREVLKDGVRLTVATEHLWAARYLLVERAKDQADGLFLKVSYGLRREESIRKVEDLLRKHGYDYYKGYVQIEEKGKKVNEYYFLVKRHLADTIRAKLDAAEGKAALVGGSVK